MIKVTTQNGTSYEFPEADAWEVFGHGMKIFKSRECVAEFSAYLLVQSIVVPAPEPVPEPQPEPEPEQPIAPEPEA